MAITQKYSTNAALQYNEVLTDYLINDAQANKKFLTNAPLNRLIRANELSALYFLIDDAGFSGTTILKFKDDSGALIYEEYTTLTSTYNIHNGLLVGFNGVPYYVPANTKKICAVISSNVNVFNNPNFAEGSGNLFTSWTLTQPNRTNLLLRSQEFDNASWVKSNTTVSANATTAPDGTMTADRIDLSAGTLGKLVAQTVTNGSNVAVTTHVFAKYNAGNPHRYIQIQIDSTSSFCNFDLLVGVKGTPQNCTAEIFPAANGFYRIIVTQTSIRRTPVIWAVDSIAAAGASTTSSTGSYYLWGFQEELGLYPTPYIPTTTAAVTTSLGEFLQDATGGIDGGRAFKLWADVGGITYISQSRALTTTNYIFKAWAKIVDTGVTNPKIGLVINGVDVGRSAVLTTTYQWIEIPFSATAGTYAESIFYENDEVYGFAMIDNVSIRKAVDNEITEERCFILDERCFENETEVQWINKLGGVDTWTFCGNPIEGKSVSRNGLIENPMEDNFTAPNEIFSFRDITSNKIKSLFHRCADEETAVWLRDELIDSIAVYVKVGSDFYPILPTATSIETKNFARRDVAVRLDFRFAFNVNVQQR